MLSHPQNGGGKKPPTSRKVDVRKTHKEAPKWKYLPELQIEGIHNHLAVMVYIRSEERALILKKVIYHA